MTTATQRQTPTWAGENWQSKLVNLLIHTKPLYALMKTQARQLMIKTAEKNGIPWRETVAQLDTPALRDRLDTLTNPDVAYPDYYQKPFHAYTEGNLCWEAAFEAEPAAYATAWRTWADPNLSGPAAHARMRAGFHRVLADCLAGEVRDILDLGCSIGLSTRSLHDFIASRQEHTPRTVGLELSPHMLAVAEASNADGKIAAWIHAPAEATGLPNASFDLVALQLVAHELPQTATRAICTEALRLLRPGGTLAIADGNPHSAVMKNLSPVLFTLMKSTEPWLDEYYTLDLEATLADLGYAQIVQAETDLRRRAIIAQKPAAYIHSPQSSC